MLTGTSVAIANGAITDFYADDTKHKPEKYGKQQQKVHLYLKLRYFININYEKEVEEQVEISVKYEGYITKSNKEVEKMILMEKIKIPADINYDDIHNLASEAVQKLKLIKVKGSFYAK